MIDDIFMYTSLVVSIIGIGWCLIIFWQFITGRDYWGQDRNSMIVPSVIVSVIPMFNVMYWVAVCLLYIGAFCMVSLISFREKAVEKRNKMRHK